MMYCFRVGLVVIKRLIDESPLARNPPFPRKLTVFTELYSGLLLPISKFILMIVVINIEDFGFDYAFYPVRNSNFKNILTINFDIVMFWSMS